MAGTKNAMKKHQHKLRKDLEAGGMSREEAKETMKGATGEHNNQHRRTGYRQHIKNPSRTVVNSLGIEVSRSNHKQRNHNHKSRRKRHKR